MPFCVSPPPFRYLETPMSLPLHTTHPHRPVVMASKTTTHPRQLCLLLATAILSGDAFILPVRLINPSSFNKHRSALPGRRTDRLAVAGGCRLVRSHALECHLSMRIPPPPLRQQVASPTIAACVLFLREAYSDRPHQRAACLRTPCLSQ